ncbi:MAG: MFS transporter [Anaerolineae bacterium]|nr:MFS transporter [Anaerolineae bacterium]
MSTHPQRGFAPVLANRPFRALWIAQALAQTAQNSINFMQMVLVERMTGSSTQMGLMILSFTLPGILVSPIAGIVVDRVPKKWVLVASNALRFLLTLGYFVILGRLWGWHLLLAMYGIAFTLATVGQFFGPAEASTIPLLVGHHNLVAANALFNLTLAGSQIMGLIILGPLAVKLAGERGGFAVIAIMYALAAYFVAHIPRDQRQEISTATRGGWARIWSDVKAGWAFVLRERDVAIAVFHLTTIATLVMILAMLVPGFAARVLGMAPEDAVIVFAPAGVGMLLTTGFLGRWGYHLRKDVLGHLALVATGLVFATLGISSYIFQHHQMRLATPSAGSRFIFLIIGLSFMLGLFMSATNILAQTIIQERTPSHLRGRVFAVQFMFNNLVGIPPMLTIAGLADWLGIPPVLIGVAFAIFAVTAASAYALYGPPHSGWLHPPLRVPPEREPDQEDVA